MRNVLSQIITASHFIAGSCPATFGESTGLLEEELTAAMVKGPERAAPEAPGAGTWLSRGAPAALLPHPAAPGSLRAPEKVSCSILGTQSDDSHAPWEILVNVFQDFLL